ncbi:molybdate-anion transporter-like [Argonauta hians]
MTIFVFTFFLFLVVCIAFHFYTHSSYKVSSDNVPFHSLQRAYLGGYILATAGDWLQGPHLYALYDSYGLTKHQIELLFVVGFGSSLIFGTTIGTFADRLGRRLNCVVYGIFYIFSCLTKHSTNFYLLAFGCIFSGISTSILFTSFEAWLIHDFNSRNIDQSLLGHIFSASVLANSITAISTGLLSQFAVSMLGQLAPFDLAIGSLLFMIIIIVTTWTENYGSQETPMCTSLRNAFQLIREDNKVLCLGMIQSLFEGSMYIFVLEWTPTIKAAYYSTPGAKPELLYGLIFSAFMLSVMLGSYVFKVSQQYMSVESFMRFVLLIAAVTLFLPVISSNHGVVFYAFLAFELCVGMFWPSIGTMRGKYLKDQSRATVMSVFRIPLNIIVITIFVLNLPRDTIFICCTIFLILASSFQQWLFSSSQKCPEAPPPPPPLLPAV